MDIDNENFRYALIFFISLGLFYFLMRFITDWRKDELIKSGKSKAGLKSPAKKVYHPAASTNSGAKSASKSVSRSVSKTTKSKTTKINTTKKPVSVAGKTKPVVAKKPVSKPKVAVKKAAIKKPAATVRKSAVTRTVAKKPAVKKPVVKKAVAKKPAVAVKKAVAAPAKSVAKKPTAKRVKPAPRKQDLTKIEGVGPKIAKLLNDGGIKTYKQLAESKKADLLAILKKGGSRFTMHDPSTWARQSSLAHQARWDDLKKLQDKL